MFLGLSRKLTETIQDFLWMVYKFRAGGVFNVPGFLCMLSTRISSSISLRAIWDPCTWDGNHPTCIMLKLKICMQQIYYDITQHELENREAMYMNNIQRSPAILSWVAALRSKVAYVEYHLLGSHSYHTLGCSSTLPPSQRFQLYCCES